MDRSRIHLLVVDDDPTQGKALEAAFNRAGYRATVTNSYARALDLTERQVFHGIFVDCVLPKKNGVDLVMAINARQPDSPPKSFLYSGIFKDRAFIKEATDRTQCEAYFVKPLDLEEVIARVDQAFRNSVINDEPPTIQLYRNTLMTENQVSQFINEDITMHAFHLPALLRHMQSTRLSGDLTVISAIGAVSSISFYDGRIFSVQTPDKDTFFGAIAVGFGFVTPDDVLEALRNPDPKLLGVKLIDSVALSPHAINVVLEEQLALRLSSCIQDHLVSLQWSHRKFALPEYSLAYGRFEELTNDWMKSKFPIEWIRSFFTQAGNNRIEGQIHPTIGGVESMNELLAHPDLNDKTDLIYLFGQLLKGEATIGDYTDEKTTDFQFLEKRVSNLLANYKQQNYFQILGLGEKAQKLEVKRAYEELAATYDPKNLPPICPPKVAAKCTQAFQYISEAFATLGDDTKRSDYLLELDRVRREGYFQNEPLFRAAIAEIQSGHAKSAAKKFQALIDKKCEFKDLRAYRVWAGLKIDRNYRGITLDQIPPEERHSAPYMMAKGLYYRNKGHMQKAVEAFRTAFVLDSKLNEAKLEIRAMIAEMNKKGSKSSPFRGDVTSVIDSLFGKIKRGA